MSDTPFLSWRALGHRTGRCRVSWRWSPFSTPSPGPWTWQSPQGRVEDLGEDKFQFQIYISKTLKKTYCAIDLLLMLAGPLCMEAPYNWRHASLGDVKAFLESEVRANRFHPRFQGGLDLWNLIMKDPQSNLIIQRPRLDVSLNGSICNTSFWKRHPKPDKTSQIGRCLHNIP